jgi:predicted kinase
MTAKASTLLIIRGLPGSGKSTRALSFVQSGAMDVHLEADQFFTDSYGVYRFDPTLVRDAHAWCQRETEKALGEGKSVVVSNTFTQMWELQPYIEIAERSQCGFGVIECTGNWANVHDVPSHQLERMRARWEKLDIGRLFAGNGLPSIYINSPKGACA